MNYYHCYIVRIESSCSLMSFLSLSVTIVTPFINLLIMFCCAYHGMAWRMYVCMYCNTMTRHDTQPSLCCCLAPGSLASTGGTSPSTATCSRGWLWPTPASSPPCMHTTATPGQASVYRRPSLPSTTLSSPWARALYPC